MPTIEETINTLKDMGFPEERAKKALNKTGWSGVESAMEWLLSHPEGEDEEEEDEEMQAEPEVPKVPLTPEEKAQKIIEMEQLRVKKRAEREEREKQEQIEKEKRRVAEGKIMSKTRQQVDDQEIKKLAEERRREKLETAKAKQRALDAIESDKRARKLERDAAKGINVPKPTVEDAPKQPQRNYDETKIQIRLQDGKKLEQTFKAKEPLSAVRVYLQMNCPDLAGSPIKLMTSFPRKVFSEEDYEKPLEVLGLCPSAVIIMSK